MAKTFKNLKDQLKLQLGTKTDQTSEDDSWLGTWVNDAYLDLTTQNKFYFNLGEMGTMVVSTPKDLRFPLLEETEEISVGSGENSYNLSNLRYSCMFVYDIRDITNDVNLQRINYRKFRTYDTSTTGSPTQYTRYGNKLYFYPTLDDDISFKISYRRRPEAMTSDDEYPVIDEEWHQAILTLAVIKGFLWRMEYEKARMRIMELASFIKSHVGILDNETYDENDNVLITIHPLYV